MTEGGWRLIYDASVKLYHSDKWSDPLLPILQPWWMTNYILVSHCLMNIKCQVCGMCMCVCVRVCRVQAERLQRKLGKAFCYNLSLALHRSHPRQHSHTYCTESYTHIHLHTYCLPCIEPMQLFLALLLYPHPYLPPWWLRTGTRAATGTDMNKAVIIKTTHQKQYEL